MELDSLSGRKANSSGERPLTAGLTASRTRSKASTRTSALVIPVLLRRARAARAHRVDRSHWKAVVGAAVAGSASPFHLPVIRCCEWDAHADDNQSGHNETNRQPLDPVCRDRWCASEA